MSLFIDSCAKISINITRTDIIRADERNSIIRLHFSVSYDDMMQCVSLFSC